MRNLEVYKIQFDPEKSEDELIRKIFKNETASVLWCSIKTGHVTDQYFNERILKAADQIGNTYSMKYSEFLIAVRNLTFDFGRIYVEHDVHQTDHEFWVDVFNSIRGKRLFKIETQLKH